MSNTTRDTHCTDVETWDEARFLAELDYSLNKGTTFQVSTFTNYVGDDSVDHYGAFEVRLEKTDCGDLNHRNDEFLDPYWDVAVLGENGHEYAWTFGPSYRVLESARNRIVAS
jgi:hypothetical protein